MSPTAIIVRHGRTDWNERELWQGGEVDRRLTPRGELAATLLSRSVLTALGSDRPQVFTSPAARAYRTALLLAPEVVPNPMEELRELASGRLSGLTYDQVEARYPAFSDAWWDGEVVLPPGGDTRDVTFARVRSALGQCDNRDGPWLAVAHLGVLRVASNILGLRSRRRIGNLEGLIREGGRWRHWKAGTYVIADE